ncbi:MAG TPA: (2Fe-2S)-binding protein [Candidatus Acidoferrales bacterium]|nr:(2Fe-2S)-binding protein [Candidatus Acidoferrales bacterium]
MNGQPFKRRVQPRMLLVDFLRDELGLTGTHIGCDTGHCGACTVMLDGLTVKSCLLLAAQARGLEVQTIEGLNRGGKLHPLQQAFLDHQGLQCGYCTPGMILSSLFLLNHNPNPTDNEIKRAIDGNLCRCTGYLGIVRAVREAASVMRENLRPSTN